MAKPIQMPALSPTMKEGKITKWLKKVGDKVSSEEPVAEVETDKSNLEVLSYEDGYLLAISVNEGDAAEVGAPIGFVGEKGEKGEKVEAGGAKAAAPAAPVKKAEPAKAPAAPAKPAAPAAPAAKAGGPKAKAVQMPALSPTMNEGKITRWLKKEGDQVSSEDVIAEVETDKSNLEVLSYVDGILLKIRTPAGETAPVGAPIAWVGPKGAQIIESPEEPPAESRPQAPAATQQAAQQKPSAQGQVVPLRPQAGAPAPKETRGGRVFASPLAKRIARERGIDLGNVQGTGPAGRIVKRDIEQAAVAKKAAPAAAAKGAVPGFGVPVRALGERPAPTRVELSTMRKVIAQRMSEVKPGVPHFYLTLDIEMDEALRIRDEAKQVESKISVNDIIVKAMAIALRRMPKMNVSLEGDHILQFDTVDVGVAVALDDGLITPVVRDADLKGLAQISAETRELAERARSRRLRPEEYSGGSITISNLGMYGIDNFGAVINPPQAAILAVGAATDKVVVKDGQMVVRKIMTGTLSVDHRVIDGALGAQYLKELKQLLEHPLRLLF